MTARGDASRPWLPALLFAVAMLGLALALVAALTGWRTERVRAEALSSEADSLRRVVHELRDSTERSRRTVR